MKKKRKGLCARFRLGRRGKTVRNLLLTLLFAALIWGQYGCPMPTAEMEFRRLERMHLLPQSEIVFAPPTYRSTLNVSRDDRTFTAEDGTELTIRGRWIVGAADGWAVIASVGNWQSRWFMLTTPLAEDGPALLPLTDGRDLPGGYWVEEGSVPPSEGGGYQYQYHNFYPLLVLNVPEETARLEVVLEEQEGAERLGTGWNMGDGVWLAGIERQWDPVWYLGLPYTLRLYSADGALLLEQGGEIPIPEPV